MSASIRVVIVNWNAAGYLRACLSSLADAQPGGPQLERVTVVDNASTDGSTSDLHFPSLPLEIIHNEANVGFAAACNQGAAGSSARYLLFLNPDVRVFADTLTRVTDFMDGEQARDVGICGVAVLHADGSPAISCARFPTLRVLVGKASGLDRVAPRAFPAHHMSPAELDHSQPVDQVIGAFFLVRRELFAELGGFDTRYFIYFEEVDLALRARRAGWRSYFLREAQVVHAENVSSSQVPSRRLFHSLRSRLLFAYRHWPRWQAHLLVLATCGLEMPARAADAVRRGRPGDLVEIGSAYRRLCSAILRRLPPERSL